MKNFLISILEAIDCRDNEKKRMQGEAKASPRALYLVSLGL